MVRVLHALLITRDTHSYAEAIHARGVRCDTSHARRLHLRSAQELLQPREVAMHPTREEKHRGAQSVRRVQNEGEGEDVLNHLLEGEARAVQRRDEKECLPMRTRRSGNVGVEGLGNGANEDLAGGAIEEPEQTHDVVAERLARLRKGESVLHELVACGEVGVGVWLVDDCERNGLGSCDVVVVEETRLRALRSVRHGPPSQPVMQPRIRFLPRETERFGREGVSRERQRTSERNMARGVGDVYGKGITAVGSAKRKGNGRCGRLINENGDRVQGILLETWVVHGDGSVTEQSQKYVRNARMPLHHHDSRILVDETHLPIHEKHM